MKKLRAVLLILVLMFLFSSCSRIERGETPLTESYLKELGYLEYTNENYLYLIRYPDIFDNSEEYDNGIVLTSDEAKLSVWATKSDESIEDSFNAAKQTFSDYFDEQLGKNKYSLFYKDGETRTGYYYAMKYFGNFYGFKFTFPADKKEEYQKYIENIIKNFLITEPK